MTTTETWTGDWQNRIKLQVNKEGYENISSYLRASPNIPLFKIARNLGANVAAVQLAMIYFAEANEAGGVKSAARDVLCRVLHSNLRKGWNGGMHAERMMAGAYSEWLSTMEFRSGLAELRQVAEHAWDALEKSKPFIGWLPISPEDERLVNSIDRGWEESMK
jgi:hypothetical protein